MDPNDDRLLQEMGATTDTLRRMERYIHSKAFSRKIMWSVGWGIIASALLMTLIILVLILIFSSTDEIVQWIQHPPQR